VQLTSKNLENQLYLLTFENGQVLNMMLQLLRMCSLEIPLHQVVDPADKESLTTTLREALLSTMKFLVDLTHNEDGKGI
jgi:hypothetical protein